MCSDMEHLVYACPIKINSIFYFSVEISKNLTASESKFKLELLYSSIAKKLKIKSHEFLSDFEFGVGTAATQLLYYIYMTTNAILRFFVLFFET